MAIAGAIGAGNRPLDGRLDDLRASVSPAGVVLSWTHADAPEFAGRLAVAVDGYLMGLVPAKTERFALAGMEAGTHRVDVRPIRADVRRVPDMHGAAYGRRAFLRWPAADASDVRAYLVYTDGGSGEVDYEAPIAAVDGAVVHARRLGSADEGTGTGRISVAGDWLGQDTNAEFTVQVGAEATFRHDVLGTWSTWERFRGRQMVQLPYGVRLTFEDVATRYDEGDVWTFRVGPPVEWNSPELAAGAHRFAVAARDVAGNVGEPLTERAIRIILRPAGVVGATAEWDGTEIHLRWELVDDDLSAIEVWSNWSNTFQRLGARVLDGAWMTLAGDTDELSFVPGESGLWRFYVRPVDADGRVSDSVELLTVDTREVPTGAQLRDPEDVQVAPAPDGALRVSWRYPVEDGQGVVAFAIWIAEDDEGTGAAEPVLVPVDGLPGFGVAEYSWTSLEPFAAARWFSVRARNGDDVETPHRAWIMGVPDADAPSMTGRLAGVPN